MLGDLISKIKISFTQNLLCKHDYYCRTINCTSQEFEIRACKLCGRVRVKQL